MCALVAAKIFTLAFPLLFGAAVDTLDPKNRVEQALTVGLALILAYGVARILMQAFNQLRDAIAAKVVYHTVRSVAGRTFRHIHALSLRFHLERKTGGLTRVIERGTRAIDVLLFYALFSIFPTILELALVTGYLLWAYHWGFAVVTMVTVVLYTWFTIRITEWRTEIRRQMNESDTEANTKAVDSLLNYETVKYFNNEYYEARRYDDTLQAWENAAIRNQTSLSLLNVGQGVIIAAGVTWLMMLAGSGVIAGRMSIGDLVLVNAFLIQLYMPLHFLGFVYREIRHSLADMERMFSLLERDAEVEDRPSAPPLVIRDGAIRFEHVSFHYDANRRILFDVDFEIPAGHKVA
ncbi:MAG: ABC transporter transmembrane domain-containing protein, partial [Terriglobales bacterium]